MSEYLVITNHRDGVPTIDGTLTDEQLKEIQHRNLSPTTLREKDGIHFLDDEGYQVAIPVDQPSCYNEFNS